MIVYACRPKNSKEKLTTDNKQDPIICSTVKGIIRSLTFHQDKAKFMELMVPPPLFIELRTSMKLLCGCVNPHSIFL